MARASRSRVCCRPTTRGTLRKFHGSARCRSWARCFAALRYQQSETDLVVIVTPHLVVPGVPGQRLASPLDSRLPSNDIDFFLNGQPEVRKLYQDFVLQGGDLKGPYGHMIDYDLGPTARAPTARINLPPK